MTDIALIRPTLRRRRRIPRTSPIIVASFLVIGIIGVLAIFGSALAPYNPHAQDLTLVLSKPSSAHPFGTDILGRDVLSRILAGARTAVLGPLVITIVAFVLGNCLGLLAGFRGGWVDTVIMRWVDVMWALPGLLVIIVVVGALGGGYWLAVGLLAVLVTPGDTRIVRAATLEQRSRPYVEAARTVGLPDRQIMLRHIWPNVAAVALAQAILALSGLIVALGGLSFLGLGVAAGTPDWGLMIAEGTADLFVNPFAVMVPAMVIVLAATSTNIIGDWLYERMTSKGGSR